jgi:hypothetical protein
MTAAVLFVLTYVWGFYGWGDNFLWTSRGVDQIAQTARQYKNVASVRVLNYWQTQQAADEISRAPSNARVVLYGYSCGANSITTIAGAFRGHRHMDLAAIQPSVWCGGNDITSNVGYAQNTHGTCIRTIGLGCKQFRPVPGNHTTHINNILLRQGHPWVDTDPRAQQDVLNVIAGHEHRNYYGGSAR